jgi:hypothetical protein
MWVLILFSLGSGNVSFAMHDFASQAACEHALEVAQGMQSELPGLQRIRPVCASPQNSELGSWQPKRLIRLRLTFTDPFL